MGSSLGPVLANIFMCDFEGKMDNEQSQISPDTHRYVDDSKDTANEFLEYLNSRTIASISLLNSNKFSDILVKRCSNNTFITSVYRKKTFTRLYTKWDSFAPRKFKVNLIRTLTYQCFRICSTASFLSLWKSNLLNAVLLGSFQAFTLIYLTHILAFLSFVIVNILWVIFFFFWQTM